MNQSYLDPKSVEDDAPKRWKKENLQLLKRLGVGNIVLILAIFALPAMGMGWLYWKHPILFLPIIPISVMFGLVFTAFQVNVLERARRGMSASIGADLSGAISEISSNGGWFKTTLFKITAFLVVMLTIFALAIYLSSAFADPNEVQESTSSKADLVDCARLMLVHMTLYILALRPNGFMSMSYFLVVKMGVDQETANRLEVLGNNRNRQVLSKVTLFIILTGLVVIFLAHSVGYFMIPVLVLPSLFFNGMNLSAWHEIYDPDGGLAEKQTVRELQLAQVPT